MTAEILRGAYGVHPGIILAPTMIQLRSVAETSPVSHRTYDYDGGTLVALFRGVNPSVPIIMISGYDRTARAKAAGADHFLNYDQWLMIGTVVSQAIAARPKASSRNESAPLTGDELSPQTA